MKIIDVISLDYNGSSESHGLFTDLKRAAEEADVLDAAGHDGIRAEFVDEADLSKEALRLVDTGTPCQWQIRGDPEMTSGGRASYTRNASPMAYYWHIKILNRQVAPKGGDGKGGDAMIVTKSGKSKQGLTFFNFGGVRRAFEEIKGGIYLSKDKYILHGQYGHVGLYVPSSIGEHSPIDVKWEIYNLPFEEALEAALDSFWGKR